MAEILGAVAAGTALGSQLIQIGCAIQKVTKKMRNARRDIDKLANETIIFAGIYKRFLRDCDEDPQAYFDDRSAIELLIRWAENTAEGLRELLSGVEALLPQSRIRFGWEERAIARLVWITSTDRIKGLRACLSVAKESLNGFSNLMCLKALKIEIDLLRGALRNPSERRELEKRLRAPLETKIKALEIDISDTVVVHRENNTTLEKTKYNISKLQQKSKILDDIPAADQVIELTKTLEDYAKELIPPRRISRRTNSVPSNLAAVSSVSAEGRRSQTSSFANSHPYFDWASHVPESTDDTSATPSVTSDRSSRPSIIETTSVSDISTGSVKVMEQRPTDTRLPTVGSTPGAERKLSNMRAGEYMNDPDGTILSPPKLKVSGAPSLPRKIARIGRHTMTLSATELTLNACSLHVDVYEHGLKFYQTLLENPGKLDSLDEALAQGDEDLEVVPGWVINPSEATVQAAVSEVRDV